MAHIQRRRTTTGEWRYDVRWRAGDEERSKSFARRKDADAYKAKVEGDELVGLVADPRTGKVTFEAYATDWLAGRVVDGRALPPRPATDTSGFSPGTSCPISARCRSG